MLLLCVDGSFANLYLIPLPLFLSLSSRSLNLRPLYLPLLQAVNMEIMGGRQNHKMNFDEHINFVNFVG